MPKIFSIEMVDDDSDELLDDEDFDPFLAAPEAFQYVPAPEFGPTDPVHVAVRGSSVGKIQNAPDAYERHVGERVQHNEDWTRKAESEAARFAEALVALGAQRAYLRYDGGGDEGFAWFDHCVMADGSMCDADELAKHLEAAAVVPTVQIWGGASPTRSALDDILASTWATTLLGEGYGTGEYVMYGAFWVDLETGLVTDDPNPAPIVRNIELRGD